MIFEGGSFMKWRKRSPKIIEYQPWDVEYVQKLKEAGMSESDIQAAKERKRTWAKYNFYPTGNGDDQAYRVAQLVIDNNPTIADLVKSNKARIDVDRYKSITLIGLWTQSSIEDAHRIITQAGGMIEYIETPTPTLQQNRGIQCSLGIHHR